MIKRDRWPSKTLFIFAAVGSAVGLGNIWRFPYLVGKYGGRAFLLPYLIALFVTGFPLLIMEFALGQKMQKSAVGAMRKIDHRISGVGLGSVLSSFGVAAYYAVIMGLLQALSVGWIYGAEKMRLYINKVSTLKIGKSWNFLIRYLIPFCLIVFLGQTLVQNLRETYGGYPQWSTLAFGWGMVALFLLISISYSYFQSGSRQEQD